MTERLVAACRVPATLPERRLGLWEIRRFRMPACAPGLLAGLPGVLADLPPRAAYTALLRTTKATLHRDVGEVVMEDTPREIRRHLPVLLTAQGRVLVSGLGLGCVVRGLLARPEVRHIDVVEIDPTILALIGSEFAGEPRVTLHQGDAETIRWPPSARWDYAWHDVWSEHEALDLVHARLLARYGDRCRWQGAWQLDRRVKRIWPDPLVNARGRDRRRRGRALEHAA